MSFLSAAQKEELENMVYKLCCLYVDITFNDFDTNKDGKMTLLRVY